MVLNSPMKEVVAIIKVFFDSFDTKNWHQMKSCLADELELDYESFRGIPKYISTSDEYIAKRKVGLAGLNTEHNTFDYLVSESSGELKCKCNFEIKRYEIEGDEYFHSFGTYEIHLKRMGQEIKISKIKQNLERSEGNRNIHGAFKK